MEQSAPFFFFFFFVPGLAVESCTPGENLPGATVIAQYWTSTKKTTKHNVIDLCTHDEKHLCKNARPEHHAAYEY